MAARARQPLAILLGVALQHQLALVAASLARAPPPSTQDCRSELEKLCDVQRRTSIFACGTCAGANEGPLHAAGCSSGYIQAFCANQTCTVCAPTPVLYRCATILRHGCHTTARRPFLLGPDACLRVQARVGGRLPSLCAAAKAQGSFECAVCIGEASAGGKLNGTFCTAADEEAYCSGQAPPSPSPATGPIRFNYTGSPQNYTVPAGVTTLNLTVAGARGSEGNNGFHSSAVSPFPSTQCGHAARSSV